MNRIIRTPEELDALPEGTVIMDECGDVYQLGETEWFYPGSRRPLTPCLPARILHHPNDSDAAVEVDYTPRFGWWWRRNITWRHEVARSCYYPTQAEAVAAAREEAALIGARLVVDGVEVEL